jgi:hypothetical protein
MKKHSYNNKRQIMEWLHSNGFTCVRDFSRQLWIVVGRGLSLEVRSMAEIKMAVMSKVAPVVKQVEEKENVESAQ